VDVHLTPEGVKQAEVLAEKLKKTSIDHIFISELKRTRQTADIVNAFHHAAIEVEPLLNDHRSGFEGQSAALLMEALDATPDRWRARFNGGESIEDIKNRVADFVSELQTKDYDSVLIVTSQWVIQAMVAVVKKVSNEQAWSLEVKQGSCLELEINRHLQMGGQ
jgi:probable phosphoglycerate mutase